MKTEARNRILIIDDNPAIHEDFQKILSPVERHSSALADMEDALFGESVTTARRQTINYELKASEDGRSGVERARVG